VSTPVSLSGLRADPIRRAPVRVFVRGLKLDAEIGVYAHEKGRAQPLVVDIEVEIGDRRIDGLADTVDYETLVVRARNAAGAGHHDLVEEFAERLGRSCLDDPRVHSVRVRVEKPGALPAAAAAGCEMTFTRE
jgi:dihydroneopterin aldolase